MRVVYICSPYRAENDIELTRNIEYAQSLTRQALNAGLAPVTPHLYMTQCLDEKKEEERQRGLTAGLELLKGCDFVIVGTKYGVSEGMRQEIQTAVKLGIEGVNADELHFRLQYEEWITQIRAIAQAANDAQEIERQAVEYAKQCACNYCKGYGLHSCTGYDCREPYQKAYEYAKGYYGKKK